MITVDQVRAALSNRLPKYRFTKALSASAVLVPLVPRDDGLQILLTRRAESMRTHSGQISFPGGRQDPSDETLADTALRETFEEVGIASSQIELLGQLPAQPTITGFVMHPFVGLVAPDYVPILEEAEVAEAFEVPLDFIADPANRRQSLKAFKGREVPIYSFDYQDYNIWGATAQVLVRFVTQLAKEQFDDEHLQHW